MMEKTGIVEEKILSQKINMKNSSWKVGGKNWNVGKKILGQRIVKIYSRKMGGQIGVSYSVKKF